MCWKRQYVLSFKYMKKQMTHLPSDKYKDNNRFIGTHINARAIDLVNSSSKQIEVTIINDAKQMYVCT